MVRRIISDEELVIAVRDSVSMSDMLRRLGCKVQGGTHAHFSRRIALLGLDTSHFTGKAWNKGKKQPERRTKPEQILVLRSEGRRQKSHLLVRSMLSMGVPHECEKCGQEPDWMGNPLTLDVDHINGNWLDDRLENLRFLCPNCHSQFSRNLLSPL